MPEGPEVRFFADELSTTLKGKRIIQIVARTKRARAWLDSHPEVLPGRKILEVFAYGKNLIGLIEGGYFFYSHQMMWGRWNIVHAEITPEVDRRERARIIVKNTKVKNIKVKDSSGKDSSGKFSIALLMSAPVFELGQGNPFEEITFLKELGPNALIYPGEIFQKDQFMKRLTSVANQKRTIGATLLDQTIVAGLGNYLRAEIMFEARLNPWRTVASLSKKELGLLCELVPNMASRAYLNQATVPENLRERMRHDETLVYVLGKEYGTRHYVFRRTNLPCLICGTKIRQLRQETGTAETAVNEIAVAKPAKTTAKAKPMAATMATTQSKAKEENDEEEKTRIVYFCPVCQNVEIADKIKPRSAVKAKPRSVDKAKPKPRSKEKKT